MADGTIKIGLELDTAKAKSQLDEFGNSSKDKLKDAGATGEESFTKFGDVADKAARVAAAGLAVLTGAVVAVGGQALNAYADYEQLVGGVDTLFKESSGKLQQYAAQAYKTSGMSANTYMEQATSFAASLVSSLGGDTAAAVESANTAMVDMSDNANKMGTDIDRITDAYQGFAKQNYTMLDNLKLGYGGTKTEMERLISDANALKEANGEAADLSIDSFADIVEAIHLVQENMGITGTTSLEAATTIQGSAGMVKAAWENVLVAFANPDADLGAVVEIFLQSLGTLADLVIPRLAIALGSIISYLPEFAAQIGDVLAPLLAEALASAWNIAQSFLEGFGIQLPDIDAQGFIDAINGIVEVVQTLAPVIAGVVAAFAAFQIINTVLGFLESFAAVLVFLGSPVGIIVTAIGLLVAGLVSLSGGTDSFMETLISNVQPIIQTISEVLANVASVVFPALSTAMGVLVPMVTQIVTAFNEFVIAVSELVVPIIMAIASSFMEFAATVAPLVTAAMTAIQIIFQTVMGIIQGVVQVALGIIQGNWSGVLGGLGTIASSIWEGVKGIFTTAMGALKSAVSSGINGVVSFFTGLGGRITGALGDMGGLLVGAGKSIINGLLSGIKSAFEGVKSFVSGIGSWIAEHKGPKEYDLGLLVPNGTWIMQSLITGFKKSMPALKTALDDTAQEIADYDFSVEGAVEVLSLDNITANVRFASPTLGSESRAASALSNIAQTINFYAEVKTPDQTAAVMKDYGMYGLAGSYA